ncbi:MAG: beta-propeller domain-containing protein, partial [Candidatus Poseidonia sp.]|nr:beta-propeller domain-containing protein [Poseidonia sp.]
PTILGELKVPGVSTYIHPLSRDHLLTIGLAPANEDGTGLDWSGTQISLFDIVDPTDPQQADALRLSPVARDQANMWSWSSSEATYESKAFQYWSPKSMLAVPLSTYRYAESYENGRYTWSYEYISKLMLVEVNESDGNLSMYGEVNHSSLYEAEGERPWWDERNIRRSIFMGDFVYAISPAGITATNLTTMEESARLSIPHSSVYEWYYMDDMVEVEDGGDRADGGDDGDDVERTRDDGGDDGEDRADDRSDDADDAERSPTA